jgi:short-subunit dehydrogenase
MGLPEPNQGSIAIVTGASSGIGVELARGLAKRGWNVGLVARRRDRLEQLASELAGGDIRAEVLPCDLEDAAQRDDLVRRVDALGLTVEVLCNNAGYGTYGDFAELDRERELAMVRANVESVVDLAGRWLPGMVERGRGALLNTASTAAFQPLPGNATYAASKAFVLSWSEALHTELAKSGVTVTALCPGPVKTEFQDVSDAHDFAAKLPKPLWVDPAAVADRALRALAGGARVVTPGTGNRISGRLSRLTPNAVLLRVLRSQSQS